MRGFRMKLERPITRNDIAEICHDLEDLFNTSFEPEPINEGGILWSSHPGMGETYKSMRFSCIKNWPWIRGGEKDAWIGDHTVIDIMTDKMSVSLRNEGAEWTLDELEFFADCFERHGFKVYRSTFPSKKMLLAFK